MYYTGKTLFEYLCGVYYTVEAVARCVLHREEAFCVLMRCNIHWEDAPPVSVGHRSRDSSKKCQRKIQIYYDCEDKLGTVS